MFFSHVLATPKNTSTTVDFVANRFNGIHTGKPMNESIPERGRIAATSAAKLSQDPTVYPFKQNEFSVP